MHFLSDHFLSILIGVHFLIVLKLCFVVDFFDHNGSHQFWWEQTFNLENVRALATVKANLVPDEMSRRKRSSWIRREQTKVGIPFKVVVFQSY